MTSADESVSPKFEGHEGRECGEHRTTGGRAWCFDCTEWCYADAPCRGCELPNLRAENDHLRRRVEHTEQWYSVRWKRLADELRGSDAWERVACIWANGTAEVTEPPTYAQQMNLLRHEVERLRKALDA